MLMEEEVDLFSYISVLTYRCVYVGEADAFGTRGILGHHCFLGLCYIFIVMSYRTAGYETTGHYFE